MLKYVVSISENAMYPELIVEIRRHMESKKTSNLGASKLRQEVQLGGKHKLDTQVSASKENNNNNVNRNYKRSKNETKNGTMVDKTIEIPPPSKTKFQGSKITLLSLLASP